MMNSTGDEDPFLQVQADVLSLLNNTRPLFTSYLRIRSSASTATSPELVEAREELESSLTDLSADLRDLIDSVKAIEQDPYRFGIELDEVERRRRLVDDVGREVEDMRRELQRTVQDAQTSGGSGKGKGVASNPDVLPDPNDFDEDEDGYAMMEQERQQELMAEQDTALDGVFRTVGNLRQQADDMGRELEEQGEMLNDVDTVADRVGGKLQNGLKRVGWVIRQNEDRYSSCCIAVLIFVLIVLLVLLLVL